MWNSRFNTATEKINIQGWFYRGHTLKECPNFRRSNIPIIYGLTASNFRALEAGFRGVGGCDQYMQIVLVQVCYLLASVNAPVKFQDGRGDLFQVTVFVHTKCTKGWDQVCCDTLDSDHPKCARRPIQLQQIKCCDKIANFCGNIPIRWLDPLKDQKSLFLDALSPWIISQKLKVEFQPGVCSSAPNAHSINIRACSQFACTHRTDTPPEWSHWVTASVPGGSPPCGMP